MREITDQERTTMLKEVAAEFPHDELMQEIHYVRRVHQLQTEGMSVAEKIAFYRRKAESVIAKLNSSNSG